MAVDASGFVRVHRQFVNSTAAQLCRPYFRLAIGYNDGRIMVEIWSNDGRIRVEVQPSFAHASPVVRPNCVSSCVSCVVLVELLSGGLRHIAYQPWLTVVFL